MDESLSRILVVDDEKMIRWGLRTALEQSGYQVEEAETAAAAIEAVNRETPDVVLLDYKLPDRTGLEVLRAIKPIAPSLPVVMITAHASVDGAVEAMKVGAYDYFGKPFEIEEVLLTVGRALEAGRLRRQVAYQHEEELREFRLHGMVAESAAMQEVSRMVRRVARSGATTILLLGESGVGKGMVARALHAEGPTSSEPFLHITCTALPETLLESELFGHEKGAFTDARIQKRGLFELANGGTVFLDEIGDLSPVIQGKLLRFLEDKVFRRVGGSRDIQVDVRIIAASNKDLAKESQAGRFRTDLYYRLQVIPIEIPPLRERRGDIEPLLRLFIRQFNADFQKTVDSITEEAMARLLAHPWPGNVRELRNAIERAVLLTDGNELDASHLPGEIGAGAGAAPADAVTVVPGKFVLPPEGLNLDELERDMLRQALERADGNRSQAARLLGMKRDQIRYRIQKFGL